jgi:hypothetical protein
MPQKCKTPAGKAGASRDGLEGASHPPFNLDAYRAQFLTLAHAVPPDIAVILAAIAFGGGQ